MSKFAQRAKKWYDAGTWTKETLRSLVEADPQRLTEEEYEEITGEEYDG